MAEFVKLWDLVQSQQLNDQEDQITWRWTADGNYSTKSEYLAQFRGSYTAILANSIWKAHAEGKLKFFAWPLVQAKILTADKLALRHWPCNPICSLYDQEAETTVHLCIHCPFAKEVWVLVKNWVGEHIVALMRMCRHCKLGGRSQCRGDQQPSKKQRQPSWCTRPGISGKSSIEEPLRGQHEHRARCWGWSRKKWVSSVEQLGN